MSTRRMKDEKEFGPISTLSQRNTKFASESGKLFEIARTGHWNSSRSRESNGSRPMSGYIQEAGIWMDLAQLDEVRTESGSPSGGLILGSVLFINAYVIAAISTGCVLLTFLVICIVYKCCTRNPDERGTYQVADSVLPKQKKLHKKRNGPGRGSTQNEPTATYRSCEPAVELNFNTNATLLMNPTQQLQPNGILKNSNPNQNSKANKKAKIQTQTKTVNNPMNGAGQEWYV